MMLFTTLPVKGRRFGCGVRSLACPAESLVEFEGPKCSVFTATAGQRSALAEQLA
jgi:hypothetical protein